MNFVCPDKMHPRKCFVWSYPVADPGFPVGEGAPTSWGAPTPKVATF